MVEILNFSIQCMYGTSIQFTQYSGLQKHQFPYI